MGKAGGSFLGVEEPEFFWVPGRGGRHPMFREAVFDSISALKSTEIRKPAKCPPTPDVPVPDAVAGYIDPGLLVPALRRRPGVRARLLRAARASIVDIAAAIWLKLDFIIPICVEKWNF